MLLAAGHSWRQEGGVARWGGALAAILALHAGAGLSGFIVWNHTEPPAPPPAAIMLELMPVSVAPPAPQVTAPPEPTPPPEPEVDFAQLLPIPDMPLTPPDIPEPEVVLPKSEPPKKKVEEAKVEKPKEKPKKEKVEKPKPKPKPEPEPEPVAVQKPTQPVVQQQAAKPAAPVRPSAAPAAPSAAEVARMSAAKATWRGILEAHLKRFHKYPRSAERRNIEGMVLLRFRMTRDGKVLTYSVERTSEHEVLDEAALAMIERAQPLPPLPAEVPGESIELIIPANFDMPDR
ncbi:MAG TPA: TonB family protein [Dongiaceae bacterium]|nr:TonB family protein [Dongiaceae bacterium]